jgi:phosphoenolpyruvate synthase/pyruvate phosphate dikinase
MTTALLQITRAFFPRPVIYRAIDFRTNEFRNLTGGEGLWRRRPQCTVYLRLDFAMSQPLDLVCGQLLAEQTRRPKPG